MEKEEQSINNISHIFDAITEIIEEEGLPAVTFSSVAKKCFLHRTSVAYYFEGKENMLSLIHIWYENMEYTNPFSSLIF